MRSSGQKPYPHRHTREDKGRDVSRRKPMYDAVVRNLAVLGEAAKNIPDEVRGRYPQVEWPLA